MDDLSAGIAAEHLVCAGILQAGYLAYMTDQFCAYDVVMEIPDHSLVRVQVKATRKPRSIPQRATHIPAYMWHVRRRGRAGERNYGVGEYDLLALVALDIGKIAYLPPSMEKKTIHIRPPGNGGSGKQFQDYTLEKAIENIER